MLKINPILPKNSLQGEKHEFDDNFWDIFVPLPNAICPTQEPHIFDNGHLGDSGPLMPSKGVSLAGGELLQTDHHDLDSELQVYTRKRFHQKNKDLNVDSAHNQPENPSNGTVSSRNPTSTSSPPPSTLPNSSQIDSSTISNHLPTISHLDIPIAIRKGVRSCPIAKYLSYHRLSKNHKAFTSRISHLFVPRNIQEALDDPN